MNRVAYSTSSTPPTLRKAPPPEYQDESWQDWLKRQQRSASLADVARPHEGPVATPRDAM